MVSSNAGVHVAQAPAEPRSVDHVAARKRELESGGHVNNKFISCTDPVIHGMLEWMVARFSHSCSP